MNPEELKFNPSHEWVGLQLENGQQIAVVGLSRFAYEHLTDIVHLELPDAGARLNQGEEFGEVESVKSVNSLYSPVSGEVVEVNRGLLDRLETIAQDPYGDSWLIKVKIEDVSELERLLDHTAYARQCAESP